MLTEVTGTGFCEMVATSLFLYDYLLTFGDEVELIWARKWTWLNVLFYLTRYLTMALMLGSAAVYVIPGLSMNSCNDFNWASAIGTFAVVILVEVILQIRIYVMYSKSRRILWINLGLFALHMGCAAALVAIYFPRQAPLTVAPNVLGSCYDQRLPQLASVWATPLAYELYLTVLAVYKTREDHSMTDPRGRPSLMAVLVRDSVVYFFLIAVVMIVNVFLWSLTTTPGNSSVSMIHASGAIGGCRLIFSLRESAVRRRDEDLSQMSNQDAYRGVRTSMRWIRANAEGGTAIGGRSTFLDQDAFGIEMSSPKKVTY